MKTFTKTPTLSNSARHFFAGELVRNRGAASVPGHRGFALVVTLTLLMLLMVLALGMLSLSSISLRASTSGNLQARAHANARLALQLAIGQLQKEAGSDQRISATASILDSNQSTPEPDGISEPYWTGIWKTGDKETEAQRAESITASPAEAAIWLVSSPDPSQSPNPLTWVGDSVNSVEVAKIGKGASSRSVRVPLVKISAGPGSGPDGKYAYWVSDESVKANASLIDPTFAANDIALSQLHYWTPQANAMHEILPMKNAGKDFRETPPDIIRKLSTTKSVELVDTVDDGLFDANESWPDFTVHSRGVIADVRRGGLKKDLTAAFEDPAPAPDGSTVDYGQFQRLLDDYGNGSVTVYRKKGATGNYVNPDGMLWMSLFFHYNSYKSSAVTPEKYFNAQLSSTPAGIGDPSGPLPYTITAQLRRISPLGLDVIPYVRIGYIAPVIIAYRVDVAISSYKFDDTRWKLRLHYYPQLVLYNPHSVRISSPNLSMYRTFSALSQNTISGDVGGEPIPETKINAKLLTGGGNTFTPNHRIQTKAGSTDTLDPGETRVYGLSSDQEFASLADAIQFTALNSEPTMSADYSQFADIPDFSTDDGDALVTLNLAPRDVGNTSVQTHITPWPLTWPDTRGGFAFGNQGPGKSLMGTGTFPSIPISSMEGAPRRIIGIYIRQKGIAPTSTTNLYLNADNHVPILMGNAGTLNPFDFDSVQWEELYVSPLGDPYQNGQAEVMMTQSGANSPWETTWGDQSAGASSSFTRKIIRDVPTQPLLSLGQFMHASVNTESGSGGSGNNTLSMGMMPIGGSYASPIIPTTDTSITASNNQIRLDDSFLANEALFDRFFFSTVPPKTLGGSTTYPKYWVDFNAANSGTDVEKSLPFLNSRMKLHAKPGEAIKLEDLRDMEKAAANLMLDGAFNVNSTSVGAWKALLSSLSGNPLEIYNATAKSTVTLTPPPGEAPIPRFLSATSTGTWNSPWDGLRTLDETELQELSENIVAEIKRRGPFLSMADFLNRRLGSSGGDMVHTGALQAAIDKTTGLNSAAKALGVPWAIGSTANVKQPMIPGNLVDGAGAPMSTATGMPGYLMQQDLVQAFSSVMTVRSDTFVIRCYGKASEGSTTVTAWCEAVVQRVPDFIDAASDPAAETSLDLLTSPANRIWGRKFQIRSFRWLSPNEI